MGAAGIGDRHDQVDVGRALPGQDLPDLPADGVDLLSVEDGIGPREVDPLEHAVGLGMLRRRRVDLEGVLRDLADLAGLDVPDELPSESVDGGALGDGYVTSVDLPEAERPEAVHVADGEETVVDEDCQ